ncbi:hypothetical protein HZU73_10105 [Apis mellifera caucasica]|nr:hypothetical protein HZU73_10105 [Apis mellifera caucasica]KAG9429401.1 hypothetical protein HZU67_08731 [Apis mellifera carnica]
MGIDNTSKLEVKSLKLQKRTKKINKSEEITTETNNIDISEYDINQKKEMNNQAVKHKKQKGKRKRSNTINNINNEIIKETKVIETEKDNSIKMKENQDEEEINNKIIPPKKKANIHVINDVNNIEELHKCNVKTPKQPSKRQIKREKAEKKENEKRMASKTEAMKKGLNYVSKWKYARTEWKFEKLRQIWLIENLLDEISIPNDIFPTVLEYFEGCKGMAREQLLKKGMDVIRKVEENEENKNKVESVVYQRARRLLQALPTE